MLTVNVICVGKLKEKFYLDAVEEYRKRLSRSCRLNLVELPEERLPERPSQAQIDAALLREYEQICTKLPKAGVVVALCIEGTSLSSQALARKFGDWAVSGISQITFLIAVLSVFIPKQKNLPNFVCPCLP